MGRDLLVEILFVADPHLPFLIVLVRDGEKTQAISIIF